MAMTKKEIIDLIYDKIGITRNECIKIVDRFFEIIKDDLIRGNDIKISGFGKWSVK